MASEQVIVDSDVFIWHLRGHQDISNRLLNLYNTGKLFLSPITVAEIYAGIRKGEEGQIQHGIALTTIIDIDFEVGRRAGIFLSKYSKSHDLKIGDAFIAATVSNFELKLWTMNTKHYPMLSRSQFYKAE